MKDAFRTVAPLLAASALVVTSCKDAPAVPFEVTIHVESDPGQPLAGAVLMKGGKESPPTGVDGRVNLKLPGQEGETVDLLVKCPSEYTSPPKAITVSLRRSDKLPQYDVLCPPNMRRIVVAVRADQGPNLPVMYLGKEVGRTDALGAATVLFQLRPGEVLELALGTSEEGNERIRPKNPGTAFNMRPYDDVVTFDQKFTWIPKPRAAPPKRNIPVVIGPKRRDW